MFKDGMTIKENVSVALNCGLCGAPAEENHKCSNFEETDIKCQKEIKTKIQE
jgi:hypothetical protein